MTRKGIYHVTVDVDTNIGYQRAAGKQNINVKSAKNSSGMLNISIPGVLQQRLKGFNP